MQKPPPWELTEPVHTKGIAPAGMQPIKGTIGSYRYNGTFGTTRNSARYQPILQSHIGILEREFQTSTANIPQSIEVQLAATRQEESTHPLPPAAAIIRELGVRNKLIQRTSAELQHQTNLSHSFYGSDPTNKSADQFLSRALVVDKVLRPDGPGMNLWKQSYRAALQAKLLTQQLALLHQQQVNVHNWLANVQANDQAQAAAAEAARRAAEQARIAAEQQRQRELAEAVRLQKEQEEIRARERERLAKLAEQRTRDAYVAQLEAEKARQNAEKEAQERARITALKLALAEAEARAEAAAHAFAAEQARLQAEMEQRIETIQKQLLAEQQSLDIRRKVIETANAVAKRQAHLVATKIQQPVRNEPDPPEPESQTKADDPTPKPRATETQNVYPASGVVASTSPHFSLTSTAIRLPPATSSAILTALRTGLSSVKAAGAALFGGPVLVGFAALLMPSRLGNGDRFAMSVPFSELSSESPQTLREIADRRGTLEMPVSLGVRRLGAGAEVFVASADDFHIRSSVLVLNAAYDLLNDVYETALPDSPTDFLTWTPAISPGNSSTESPLVDVDSPAYSGASIIPVEGRLDLHPVLVEGWEKFIIVFPDDSGIEPLYVVFSSPYAGATTKGKYSGRNFNPQQAGGPILKLNWRTAVVSQAGIDAVKLHIARLDQSDANVIMIQRLEKILTGDLKVTDTDLRYYTHEIRELERFRALSLGDHFKPDRESPLWNNAHTATLEDFKLRDDESLLYTKDAIAAADKQDEAFFKNLSKGGK